MIGDFRQLFQFWVMVGTITVFIQDRDTRRGAHAWTYNYSSGPDQRWSEGRKWCQKYFTDMVAVHNQEEADFLDTLLPFNPKYYWIGIRKESQVWTWVDSSEAVPEEVQNWAPGEPDNIAGQDCVEMYIKRRTDTTKWNNEKCRNKKGTVCYTASCTQDSCSVHSECIETVGNYTCKCHLGFQGPHCREAIACEPLPEPQHGSHHCFHPFGSNRFNSSCRFHCELGFRLVGATQLLCQGSRLWSHPVPMCEAEQCPVLSPADFSTGIINCSHPIRPYSYNSTCVFRCNEGYELVGPNQISCSHRGLWTDNVSTCRVKKCPPLNFPATGNVTCVDSMEPFSFRSQCHFTCQEGYYLTGDGAITCLASGHWSKPMPTCTVAQCNALAAPPNAELQCENPIGEHSYGSTCFVQCGNGFDLIGSNMTKCSSRGDWSHALPVCKAKRCPGLTTPTHGSIVCSNPHGEFSFGSQCTTTCEEGFLSDGTSSTECNSLSQWSADIPQCQARRCPGLNFPSHGSLVCSHPHGEFSFGSQCVSKCEDGFVLRGAANTECTSLGMWSNDVPLCLARQCPLLVAAPPHGKMNCRDVNPPFSYGSHCDFECNEGFRLKGPPTMTCNKTGRWSQEAPTCQPVQCETINTVLSPLSMNCSHPVGSFSFGSQCLFTCDEEFFLNGTAELICSSSGAWSDSIPQCAGFPRGRSTLLLYSGIGLTAFLVLIDLLGLFFLVLTRCRRKGVTYT